MKISIEKSLSTDGYVLVTNKGRDVQIFSPHKDFDGDWRRSGWLSSKESAETYIGYREGYEDHLDELAKEEGWEVEAYIPKHDKLQVGDKVVVLETGEVMTIGHVSEEKYYLRLNDMAHLVKYRHDIAPILEEDDDKTEEAIKMLKEKGFKIIRKIIRK